MYILVDYVIKDHALSTAFPLQDVKFTENYGNYGSFLRAEKVDLYRKQVEESSSWKRKTKNFNKKANTNKNTNEFDP